MRQKSELRESQQEIVDALYENDEKICVMRPGGGKTVAELTAIRELIRDGVIRHALVTAPKRVARIVWPDEIFGWDHLRSLRFAVLDGTPAERAARLATAPGRDLTIFGHDVIDSMLAQLEALPNDHPLFDLLVIDEVSRFRNPRGARYKLLAKHVHRWKMIHGLSGTLRPSGAVDLFAPARLVTRTKLWGKSFDKWRKANFYHTDYEGYVWEPLPGGTEERLNAEIAPLLITGEIPPSPEPIFVIDRIELPPAARTEYTRMEKKLFSQVGPDEDDKVVADSRAIAVGKLSQLANGFIYDNDGATRWIHDEKKQWLADIKESATGPTLVVFQFKEDFVMMQEVFGADIPYLGAGVTDMQSDQNIRDWNARKLPFLGIHQAAASHGLNLQFGGSDFAFIAPSWDSEAWDQCIARLARSGQTEQVFVRICLADHTIDQAKLDRVHGKLTAQQAFEKYLRNVAMAA